MCVSTMLVSRGRSCRVRGLQLGNGRKVVNHEQYTPLTCFPVLSLPSCGKSGSQINSSVLAWFLLKPQGSPLRWESEIPARWRQVFWVRSRLLGTHTEMVFSAGWMSTRELYLWTARRNPLLFVPLLFSISLWLNVLCCCDAVILCKGNSALILTFVIKFGSDEGENENIGREAKESFHRRN